MDRQAVNKGLSALSAELDRLEKAAIWAKLQASADRASRADELREAGPGSDLIEVYHTLEQQQIVKARTLLDTRARLEAIAAVVRRDGEDWHVERAACDRMMLKVHQGIAPVELPKLVEAAEVVIVSKAEALGERSASYVQRLRRAVRAFVDVLGDRPVSEYSAVDLQTFANTLGRLPKTWSVDPRFKGLPPTQIVERAKGIKGLKPISRTTVTEYVAEFRHIWRTIRATYPDHVRSLSHDDVTITAPRSASRPVRRQGLPIASINAVFALAARESRPEDRYLPLLAALTGARLGELVDMTPEDVQQAAGHWVLNLVTDFEDEEEDDGPLMERRLKSDNARRLIALPDAIMETGFLEWARGQAARSGPLWPYLSRTARPRATASKRQIRILKKAGVWASHEQVFHSLRHSLKDWHRSLKVDERTMNLQVGHASDSVAEHYGSAVLRPDEIKTLATLPLPEGLDLSPYSFATRASRSKPSSKRQA